MSKVSKTVTKVQFYCKLLKRYLCSIIACVRHFVSSYHAVSAVGIDIQIMCIREQLYIDNHWVQVIFFCLYAAIFVVGVAGNLVVICVILKNKHMRTTINLYLLNLATSLMMMSEVARLRR